MDQDEEAKVGEAIDEPRVQVGELPADGILRDAHTEPEPASRTDGNVGQIIERWWADHFEGNPAAHPVPYLSGAWHYALAAKDDLKARLKATAG